MFREAYFASSALVLSGTLLAIGTTVLVGYWITRTSARPVALAWLLVLVSVISLERFLANEAPGFRMVALITIGLYAMKSVVVVNAKPSVRDQLGLRSWLEFSLAWPGMQPRLFAKRADAALPQARELALRGVTRALLGAALIALSWFVWEETGSRLWVTVLLLPGLSLVLHFGLFNLLAAFWRWRGVDAKPLFRAPLLSESLSEFWSKRWNLGFSEMTSLGVYQPLRKRFGAQLALVVAFLFSGALHEMAISLPVQTGYGLPFLYFALHALAMVIERKLEARGTPIHGLAGRVWVTLWLVVPLPILFHEAFLEEIVWPIIGIATT